MKCICTLCFSFSLLFCFTMSGLSNENQTHETDVPPYLIQANDQVFFRITECDLKSVDKNSISNLYFSVWEFYNAQNPAEILESEATSSSENKVKFDNPLIEFLLKNNTKAKYRIVVKNKQWGSDPTLATIGIPNVTEILEGINKKIAENPDDREKWTITLTDTETKNQVTLAFAGIQRLYKLETVEIPKLSSHRNNAQYSGKSTTPRLCVCIDRNGKPMREKKSFSSEGVRSESTGWTATFPATTENIWEIREGINDEYSIRLRDVNTTKNEVFLLGILELRGEDFQKEIYEKLSSDEDKTTAVKFRFSLIKQQ